MGFGGKGKAGGRNPPQMDIIVIKMRVNGAYIRIVAEELLRSNYILYVYSK